MKRQIEVSEETYEKIKEQLLEEERVDINSLDYFIGKNFFFRTVTYHLIGKVKKVLPIGVLELYDASWVADSGRFTQAIKDGDLEEVEILGQWFINLNSCTDFGYWRHELPKIQK